MPKFFRIHLTSHAKKIASDIHIQCEGNFIQLETERLLFRSFNYFNRDTLLSYYGTLFGKPENLIHYGTGKVWTSEEIDDFLTQELQAREAGSLYGAFTVHEKATGSFIGNLGVEFKEREYAQIGKGHRDVAEINYILMSSAWGKGYGKELATVGKKFSNFIFASGKDRIPTEVVATVHPENIGSEKILANVLKFKEMVEFTKFAGKRRALYFKPLTEKKTCFTLKEKSLLEKRMLK